MPYEEREAKASLSSRLKVRGIPALIMLGPREGGDRPLINDSVRAYVERGDYVSEFPFQPKPYGDLNFASDAINKGRCLIVFHEGGDDEEQEGIQEALKRAAENCEEKDVRFLWGNSPTGLVKAVREALKLGTIKEEPVMALLDIPDAGSYYVSQVTSEESIRNFLDNSGEKLKLSG